MLKTVSTNRQYEQINDINEELRKQYGISEFCIPDLFGGGGASCSDYVANASSREQERTILDVYSKRLDVASENVPRDHTSEQRAIRGLLGLIAGTSVSFAGDRLKKQKR